MSETEITVQVFNDYNEIDEILKRKGFEMVENYQLNDWYFPKFDNVLNLSYVDLMNNSFLVRHIIDECPKIQYATRNRNWINLAMFYWKKKLNRI